MNDPLIGMKVDEQLAIEAMRTANRFSNFELEADCCIIFDYLGLFLGKGIDRETHIRKAEAAKAIAPTFHSGVRFEDWWSRRIEMIEDVQERFRINDYFQKLTNKPPG